MLLFRIQNQMKLPILLGFVLFVAGCDSQMPSEIASTGSQKQNIASVVKDALVGPFEDSDRPEQQARDTISNLNGEFEGSRETLEYWPYLRAHHKKVKASDWRPDGLLANGVKLKIDVGRKIVKYLAEGREPILAHMTLGQKSGKIIQRTYDDFGDLKGEGPVDAIPLSLTLEGEKYTVAILDGDSLTLYTCRKLIEGENESDCGEDNPFRLKLTRVQS